MQVIPLEAVPSQTASVVLANQQCQINVYQKNTGMFFDLIVNGAALPIVQGVICENGNSLVKYLYLGFVGDLVFLDTQNLTDPLDPTYDGLGSRYQLIYYDETDLELAQALIS